MLASDQETRIRYYLNEVSANFYTQAEIWRWISVAAKDISEKTLCVRRILTSATGGANVRNVVTNAYKTLHVEYLDTRPLILVQIDPLKIGNCNCRGNNPEFWAPYGNNVLIDPLPDAIYNLRLYVADVAKLKTVSDLDVDWTAGARWVLGDSAIHSAALSDLTYTAGISNGGNYTFEFNVTGISGTLKVTAGSVEGTTISTNGWHTQNLVSNGTTLTLTGYGDVTITDFIIYKEGEISATTDEFELDGEWDFHLALYATYSGLIKDKRYDAANLLVSIYQNEFDYLRQNIIEVIPDGREDMVYK